MRFTDDISYEDYKENVEDAFHLLDDEEIQGAADISEWLYGQIVEYADGFTDTIAMLFIISIAEYEVRHNMLRIVSETVQLIIFIAMRIWVDISRIFQQKRLSRWRKIWHT